MIYKKITYLIQISLVILYSYSLLINNHSTNSSTYHFKYFFMNMTQFPRTFIFLPSFVNIQESFRLFLGIFIFCSFDRNFHKNYHNSILIQKNLHKTKMVLDSHSLMLCAILFSRSRRILLIWRDLLDKNWESNLLVEEKVFFSLFIHSSLKINDSNPVICVVIGVLKGFDQLLNLVLENCVENLRGI